MKDVINFINWYVFFIAFIIGIGMILIYEDDPVKIYIYPTEDNKNILQVKDNADTCFSFNPQEVKCELHKNIKNIPLQ